jgi:ParB family chromosome partitioning protein
MVISGGMSFQIRKNDRDFREGEMIFLKEFKNGAFTGRTKPCRVNLTLTSFEGLQEGYVLINIELVSLHITKEGTRYETKV